MCHLQVLLARERAGQRLVAIKALKKEHIAKHDEHENVQNELAVFELCTRQSHPFLVHLHAHFESSVSRLSRALV